jgi:RNA polymerase sigma-70 factor (sigma-E family)
MTDFEQFVASHVDDLLRTAYLIVWDEVEAEDLVQDCLLKVARRWPRIRRMEQPQAYARRILVNLAIDGSRARARRRSELQSGVAAIPIAIEPLTALDIRAELLQALAQLPARQRAVLVLRYFNDLTEAQVADVLGCPAGTVKSSASRGLARLREALQPVPFEPRSTET